MENKELNQEEFQRRCEEVFDTQAGDEYYNIRIQEGKVLIEMSEIGTKAENFRRVYFAYNPDMTERPEALEYLLGNRDDFND